MTGTRSVDLEQVGEKVRQIVAELGDGPPTDETLRGLDSIVLVELVVRIEDEFRLEVADSALVDAVFDSLDNLCALVVRELCAT